MCFYMFNFTTLGLNMFTYVSMKMWMLFSKSFFCKSSLGKTETNACCEVFFIKFLCYRHTLLKKTFLVTVKYYWVYNETESVLYNM